MHTFGWALATNVKFFREKLKLSQIELAERAQISKRCVQAIESGSAKPSLITITLLAKALQVEWSELMLFQRVVLDEPDKQMRNINWRTEGFSAGLRLPTDHFADVSENFKELTGLNRSKMQGLLVKDIVDFGYAGSLKRRNALARAGFGFVASVTYSGPIGHVPATLAVVPAFRPDQTLIGSFGVVMRSELWPSMADVEKLKCRFLSKMLKINTG